MNLKQGFSASLLTLVLLSACGQNETAVPSSNNAAPVKEATQRSEAVTPYYVFDEQQRYSLVSGSSYLEQDQTYVPNGRLYLFDKLGRTYTNLTPEQTFGTDFYAEGGVLSADGTFAVIKVNSGAGWQIYRLTLASGNAQKILDSTQGGPEEVEGKTLALSADGRQLAFRGYNLISEGRHEGVARTHQFYRADLQTGVTGQSLTAPEELPITSKTVPVVPRFDDQGRLQEDQTPHVKVSPHVAARLGPQALGIVGRLPFNGEAALTDTFHGTGKAEGASWGIGLDFGPRPWGTSNMPAVAITSGSVVDVKQSGCGVYVIIDHANLSSNTFYCHLAKGSPERYSVARGRAVSAGQPLGIIGSTGADAMHLHLALIQSQQFGLRGRKVRDQAGTCNIAYNEWQLNKSYFYLGNPC